MTTRLPRLPRPAARPLLPAAARRMAVAVMCACVAVTAVLGVWFRNQARAGWLDRAVDLRLQSGLAGHWAALDALADFGQPLLVTTMSVALALAYLATRKRRGAVLVAVAVPAAGALTEYVLKPLTGRTLGGYLSYPSGHSTAVFALAAAVAVLLADPDRPRLPAAVRAVIAFAAFLAASAVTVAVVAMNSHYFTDTVGGAGVGIAVVLVTALILDRIGSPRRRAD